SSNLYGGGPTDYVKDVKLGIGNDSLGNFTFTYSTYNTQFSDTYTATFDALDYYFNENSSFSISYADTNNKGDLMVGKSFIALGVRNSGSIYYDTTMVNSSNVGDALTYFKNN